MVKTTMRLELNLGSSNTETRGDCEVPAINFGEVEEGETASAAVAIRGGPCHIDCSVDRIKVVPSVLAETSGELMIQVAPGRAGELLWGHIAFRSESYTQQVAVIARWSGRTGSPSSIPCDTVESLDQRHVVEANAEPPERTFHGRTCRWCGRTFGYDVSTHSWEVCTCSTFDKVRRCTLMFGHEFSGGLRVTVASLGEIWSEIRGRKVSQ